MRQPVRAAATRVGLVLVTSSCVTSASHSSASGSSAKKGGVVRLGIVEPTAINPYNSQWTFHLRSGTEFSKGEVVTAQSFIDGMNRAAAGEAASDTAHFMDGIEGYATVHGGADGTAPTTSTLPGLSAPDDHTLVVKLARPDCEFDRLVLQPVFSPVPKEAGKAAPGSAYYDMPIGNGPFKMREPWNHNAAIVLVRNDLYFGTTAYLDEVDFTILASDKASEAEYANLFENPTLADIRLS